MRPYFSFVNNGGSLTTTTSYQTIPNLTFNLVAGGTYTFQAWLSYQGNATGAVFQPSVGGTVLPNIIEYACRFQTNVNGASNSQLQTALSSPTTPAGSAVNAVGTTYGAFIDGLVVVGTAGTLTVQAKHATAACSVLSGGRFLLQQIA
jgi:hypothetical protein